MQNHQLTHPQMRFNDNRLALIGTELPEIVLCVPPPPAARYVNPEAHDAYVHGHYLWITGDNEEAHLYFKKAIEIQPDYALGWTGIADYYAFGQLDPKVAHPQLEVAATKALQLDDALPQAHLSMSEVYFMIRWDWAGADREALHAIELDPRFADACYFRAQILETLNRHQEAIEMVKKELEIDPFSRPYALADAYNKAREYDAAIKDAFQRFESAPNNIGLHFPLLRHIGTKV
jgi:tetratricopeptide (TPR) repeat protein